MVFETLECSLLNVCNGLFDYFTESLEIGQEDHHIAALFFASQNS